MHFKDSSKIYIYIIIYNIFPNPLALSLAVDFLLSQIEDLIVWNAHRIMHQQAAFGVKNNA